jgi:hypothetical protein
MAKHIYFAYGSNLDPTQMRTRCPGSVALGRACLAHHRLDFTYYSSRWSGGAADVLPHSHESVWGIVYALPTRDLLQLDRFEVGYDRVFLEVQPDGWHASAAEARGESADASVMARVQSYTVRDKRSFRPSARYLDQIVRWARHWQLPSDYIAGLERIEKNAPTAQRVAAQQEG